MEKQEIRNLVQLYPGSTCLAHKNVLAWIDKWNEQENCQINRFIESVFKLLTSPNERDIYAEEGETCMQCVPTEIIKHITGCVVQQFGEEATSHIQPTIKASLVAQRRWNEDPPPPDPVYPEVKMWDFEFSPAKKQVRTKRARL